MTRAAIGLGANLGDRHASLRAATRSLAGLGAVVATSRVYETAPVGPPQPDYLNAVVLLETERSPEELLDGLLAIERSMGRVRAEKWGPRVIDLDLLWMDGVVVVTERLTVPHPHLRARAFALAPMLEVVPDARDPVTGERYAALELDRSGLRLIEER
ncbi:MAG TPA: 2-amino-4-hydroxy-6-hydroxymethyldihydropteridine diphosphokinase [Polyangiaceae bacterium]|nr:2-amino-4-hydroxy-6-hydroxymethyldihydropteridine diphosphokinase [Polyangiaceae bacterium]